MGKKNLPEGNEDVDEGKYNGGGDGDPCGVSDESGHRIYNYGAYLIIIIIGIGYYY